MDKQAIFEAWAPPESIWSAWCKPVLFAHLPRPLAKVELPLRADVSWVPPPVNRHAIVVERPGAESVAIGLALAQAGYRPVPLFNACPPPAVDPAWHAGQPMEPVALVDVDAILAALVAGAEVLPKLHVAPDAPPAFLLDANRNAPRLRAHPGLFDNRSIVFTTDFPSAEALAQHGIPEALVVAGPTSRLSLDLEHVLRTWSAGGLKLSLLIPEQGLSPRRLLLRAPRGVTALWLRLRAWLVLKRSAAGGFGGFVPEAASG